MNITKFISAHRAEIDAHIKRVNPGQRNITDSERRLWVLNDEGLYNWARRERYNDARRRRISTRGVLGLNFGKSVRFG